MSATCGSHISSTSTMQSQHEGMKSARMQPPTFHSQAFSVLHEKSIAVSKVELCPKMDLLALLRTDGSVVVLRTISWQRLNTLPAATLQDEKRVTAMSWSPDGNVLALGHAQGAISFLDVEKGERARQPLGARPASAVQQGVEALQWFTQQREPATMSSEDWEKNLTQAAGKYYLDRDAVFWEELPPLGLQSGSFAVPRHVKQDSIEAKLAAGVASLDVLVACFQGGHILVFSSGLLPVVSLRLRDFFPPTPAPSLADENGRHIGVTSPASIRQARTNVQPTPSPAKPASSPPSILLDHPSQSFLPRAASPTLSPPALSVQSLAASRDLSAMVFTIAAGEGSRGGVSTLVVPTAVLWTHRHQLRPLTVELAAVSGLVSHLLEALDMAERQWNESVRTLDIKLELLNSLLRDYACEATAREALLSFVLSGVACPALSQYLSQNGSEPQQQNMFRLLKTMDDKIAGVEGLLREQVARVGEMIAFRAVKLRGLARSGPDYQALGLSTSALSALIKAAGDLSVKAEETLREVQRARQNIKVFVLWLLDTMQHLPPTGTEEPPAASKRLTFRHSTKHTRMLLSFLRKPVAASAPTDSEDAPGEKRAAGPTGNTEAVIAVHISSYFKDQPLPMPPSRIMTTSAPARSPGSCDAVDGGAKEGAKGLASVSLRTQVKWVLARFEAVFRRPLEAITDRLSSPYVLLLSQGPLASPPSLYAPARSDPSRILMAAVSSGGARTIVLSIEVGALASRMRLGAETPNGIPHVEVTGLSLDAPAGFSFQQAALYGSRPHIPSSNPESIVLLVRENVQPFEIRTPAELWKLPLTSLLTHLNPVDKEGGARACLLDGQGARSLLPWEMVSNVRTRQVAAVAPRKLALAVTGCRGIACVTSESNFLLLADLEEDEDEDEEEEGNEGEGQGVGRVTRLQEQLDGLANEVMQVESTMRMEIVQGEENEDAKSAC